MTDHLKQLFDQLRQADQSLADQDITLGRLRRERQAAHDAIWTAIEAELDATIEWNDLKKSNIDLKQSNIDLKQSVEQLQTLVMELSARLPPPR